MSSPCAVLNFSFGLAYRIKTWRSASTKNYRFFSKISPNAETIEVKEGKNEQTIDVGKAVRMERIITTLQ